LRMKKESIGAEARAGAGTRPADGGD